MKRKILIVLLSIVCVLCLAFGLSACDGCGGSSGSTDGEQNNEQTGVNTDDGDGSSDEDGSSSSGSSNDDNTDSSSGDSSTSGGSSSGDTEQDGSTGGGTEEAASLEYTLSSDGNSYTISGIGTCTDTEVEIPSTYEGKPVTAIGDNAFYGCTSLKNVTIPNSITTIGASAFGDCTALITITIGEGVISIGSGAFSGCYKLLEIYNLSALTITAGSSDNGGAAYYAKDVYTSADAESKITETNYFIFYNDNGEYYLIGYIGKDTEITLPDSVNGNSYEIYNYAFYLNTKLTKVVISDGVTAIGSFAFGGCYSLLSVTIGRSVASIGSVAFYYCPKLIEVYNLSSLDITAGSSFNGMVAEYAKDVYTSTDSESKLIYKNDYIFYNDDGTYYLIGYKGTDTDITLPKNIDGNSYEIYNRAFYYNTKITNVNIPNGVTSISYNAFGVCTSLTNVTIPDSVTTIDSYAFYDCISLTNVTIGNNVTSIGGSAFEGCYSLTNVIIPDSVTTIYDRAFYGCYSLVSVTIGSGVTSIVGDGDEEYFAFSSCPKLIEVYNLSSLVLPREAGVMALWRITLKTYTQQQAVQAI